MGELRRSKKKGIWSIRYYRNGKRYEESSRSTNKSDAQRLLRQREGDIARGMPVAPRYDRFTFDDGFKDVVTDLQVNARRSVEDTQRRIDLHLLPFFAGRRMASITTADIRRYVEHRRAQPIVTGEGDNRRERQVSNGQINRELTVVKRAFVLAMQSGKLLHRPHVPMLKESAPRAGFFEREQYEAVLKHLPEPLRPVVTFAYVTGWRVHSEVLPLTWAQVDLKAGVVRLEPGSTKNGEGREFHFTASSTLGKVLQAQREATDRIQREMGCIIPTVFYRMVAKGRGGKKHARPIVALTKAWKTACAAAGCPGRIPHDLRRTAVRNLVRAGVPERVAMQLTGHRTPSVFARYNIVSTTDLRAAATRLDEHLRAAEALSTAHTL